MPKTKENNKNTPDYWKARAAALEREKDQLLTKYIAIMEDCARVHELRNALWETGTRPPEYLYKSRPAMLN